MTSRTHTSYCASRLAVSLLLLLAVTTVASAQKIFRLEKDSIPLFRGFSVSFDLAGPATLMLSDRGAYEGALRVNLHDQWFPALEVGVGHANHHRDEITGITYKTTAPFFRLGMDWNIMKNKHAPNRIYAGVRYAFTSYKCDVIHEGLSDPVFLGKASFDMEGVGCSMHWLEAVFGIDAKLYGPLHLGWTLRYKRRLAHNEGVLGTSWYVPGFGLNDNETFTFGFNVIVDI